MADYTITKYLLYPNQFEHRLPSTSTPNSREKLLGDMLTNRSPGLVRQLYSAIVLILSTFFPTRAVVFVVVVVVAFPRTPPSLSQPIPVGPTDPGMNESFFSAR